MPDVLGATPLLGAVVTPREPLDNLAQAPTLSFEPIVVQHGAAGLWHVAHTYPITAQVVFAMCVRPTFWYTRNTTRGASRQPVTCPTCLACVAWGPREPFAWRRPWA